MEESCAPPPLVFPPRSDRLALIREAFRLEWLTIGWMTVEAVVAIASGVTAGSLVLIAFGLDSVIELASAGALMWRLSVELRHGSGLSEGAERIASQIGGCSAICSFSAYVVLAAGWNLWTQKPRRVLGTGVYCHAHGNTGDEVSRSQKDRTHQSAWQSGAED